MLDPFNRRINYLRISVTDRCNLRCVYCMPAEGVLPKRHDDILRYDEIVDVVKVAVSLGVDKVRITGGEPLVRKGIVNLVAMIAEIDGIVDLGMTTNGILLDRYAVDLAKAGLHRVNVSLDTLDKNRYSEITRGGIIDHVFKGLDAAREAGLTPIKINCVIQESSQEPDAIAVRKFAEDNGFGIRFIHQMNLESGYFKPVEGGDGGNCAKCSRLRLTSDGYIHPCLFSPTGYSVRELGPEQAIRLALKNKPWKGGMNPEGHFYSIGG